MIKKSLIAITLLFSGFSLANAASVATDCLLPNNQSGAKIIICNSSSGINNSTPTGPVPAKPRITYLSYASGYLGDSIGIFWGSTLPVGSWTYANYKVNSTVVPSGEARSGVSFGRMIEYDGFVIGTNTISVQACNANGCGAWSDTKTLVVRTGWSYPICTTNVSLVTRTVTASAVGTVYGSGPLFAADSNLATVATYLGAKVGSKATLAITGSAGCASGFTSGSRNGITTQAYDNGIVSNYALKPIKKGVIITCTSGCGSVGDGTNNVVIYGPKPIISVSAPHSSSLTKLLFGDPINIGTGISIRGSITGINYRVNSTITQGNKNEVFSGVVNRQIVEYEGFMTGTNTIAIQTCDKNGCSPWSDEKTVFISSVGWRYTQCGVTLQSSTTTVTASAAGTVYGSRLGFSTDSSLATIATYLGAKVGDKANLLITDARYCDNFISKSNNGITTEAYDNGIISNYSLKPIKNGVLVTCTSGCDFNPPPPDGPAPLKPKVGVGSIGTTMGSAIKISALGSKKGEYTGTNYRVNSTVTQGNTLEAYNGEAEGFVIEYDGFKAGDNKIAIQVCNRNGCSPWSDETTFKVSSGWGFSKCDSLEISDLRMVTAVATGTVYGSNRNPVSTISDLNKFTTDSDLGAVATYLGAKVGSKVTLQISSKNKKSQANTLKNGCPNLFISDSLNGITTRAYDNGINLSSGKLILSGVPIKKGVQIILYKNI